MGRIRSRTGAKEVSEGRRGHDIRGSGWSGKLPVNRGGRLWDAACETMQML